ncbi:hypothetical protein EHP00_1428 [Ecytonucleospora hepatopenaei]|uniref:PUA domain-containing protein n=1 Tax=Ecytonucleospora hepatopenaei TaxID=646526 RepID=A0A1W0E577_9MICR|nr:hypothetical protein EHP00_1428 [Ecytonucleospora hepatopenaei]
MKYFEKQTVVQSNFLSKKDVKEYIKKGIDLDPKQIYKVFSLSNKSKVIADSNKKLLCFTYYDKVVDIDFDKLNNIQDQNKTLKKVFLDKGALNAVNRGADIMAPGILKYSEKQSEFKEDDIVYVEIENEGIYCVGVAIMSMDDIIKTGSGKSLEVIYIKDGCLKQIIA